MSIKIKGKYTKKFGTTITHTPSGTVIKTAAPKDNNGDGSSFSPTDLLAASLGSCMLTIIGIVANRLEINIEGATFEVEKHMISDPRRIGKLSVDIYLPKSILEDDRKKLERGAMTCPVHKSLLPEIEIPVRFIYE